MHKLWATKGCPGFVVELNTYNISAVESHVAYHTLEEVPSINVNAEFPNLMILWAQGDTRIVTTY